MMSNMIKIGEFVNTRSIVDKEYYLSQVVRVFDNGDVRVHFPGWTAQDDEIIPAEEVSTQISPLYSHSLDRRKWIVGDWIDFQCSIDFALWTPASIVAVDKVNDSVAVQLLHEEINKVLVEHRGASSASLVKEDSTTFKITSDHIAPIHTVTKKSHKRSSFQALATALSSPTILTRARCHAAVASPTPSTSSNIAHPTCTTNNTTASTNALLPVASTLISPLQTSSTTPTTTPTTTASTSTWLAPLLLDRYVSEQHVQLCEQALVRDEGFTNPTSFATGISKPELAEYLEGLGTMPKGLQANVLNVHLECVNGVRGGGMSGEGGVRGVNMESAVSGVRGGGGGVSGGSGEAMEEMETDLCFTSTRWVCFCTCALYTRPCKQAPRWVVGSGTIGENGVYWIAELSVANNCSFLFS